jgi:Mg2+/Co2+ transporter CorB
MISSTVTLAGIGATLVLLLLSAFFSSSEIAIFSLSTDQVDQLAATGDADARLLQELYSNPHRLLVTLLVGNNIVNIAISSIITILVVSYLPAGTAVVVTTLLTSLVSSSSARSFPKHSVSATPKRGRCGSPARSSSSSVRFRRSLRPWR